MNQIKIYDSHCHLEAVKNNLQQIKIAIPGIILADIPKLLEYRSQNQLAKIGFGIHPWFIAPQEDHTLLYQELKQAIINHQPNFIGETGLDKNKPHFTYQLQMLSIHLELAQEFDLPVILHCVRAYNELLELLTKYPKLRGVVHAYNSNNEMARQLARKNMYLGIGSIILNENSQLAKSIAKIPSKQLLLESGAPYMPPQGSSHSTTENCLFYAQKLAQLQNKNLMELIHEANQNWKQLFSV